jgi:hypothetical protein
MADKKGKKNDKLEKKKSGGGGVALDSDSDEDNRPSQGIMNIEGLWF